MQNFKDLIVWQKSRVLAKNTYEICKLLPKDEVFGLSSQMKRSAISIVSNIAEGFKRRNSKEFAQFLAISSGSAAELEAQLILTSDIFQVDTQQLQLHINEIQRMLTTLEKKVRS